MSTAYSIGSTNQLGDAFEADDWTPDDITKLKQFKDLLQIRDVINGRAVIIYPQYIIDCNATPFCPNNWSVEKHSQSGQMEWDPSKVQFYLSKKQMSGLIEGNKLRKELSDKNVLNANVLDYLLKHPGLIPDDWKGKFVFFWGTIYRDSDGNLYVRCLYWDYGEWDWSYRWLGNVFSDKDLAAVASIEA